MRSGQLHSKSLRNRDFLGLGDACSRRAYGRWVRSHVVSSSASLNTISSSDSIT